MSEFESILNALGNRPNEPCVIRRDYLNDCRINIDDLASASGRTYSYQSEVCPAPGRRNMAVRDSVFLLRPVGS